MLRITEYAKLLNNNLPIPVEPDLGSQVLEVGDMSVQSAAWPPGVSIIRVHAEEACALHFGPNPTATADGVYMPQGATDYFAVQGGHKVAVIGLGNKALGGANDLSNLLHALSDPKATKQQVDALSAKAADAAKASAALKKTTDDAQKATAAAHAKQAEVEARIATFEKLRDEATQRDEQTKVASAALAGSVKAHEDRVKAWVKQQTAAEAALAKERADFKAMFDAWNVRVAGLAEDIKKRTDQLDKREAAIKAAEADLEERVSILTRPRKSA